MSSQQLSWSVFNLLPTVNTCCFVRLKFGCIFIALIAFFIGIACCMMNPNKACYPGILIMMITLNARVIGVLLMLSSLYFLYGAIMKSRTSIEVLMWVLLLSIFLCVFESFLWFTIKSYDYDQCHPTYIGILTSLSVLVFAFFLIIVNSYRIEQERRLTRRSTPTLVPPILQPDKQEGADKDGPQREPGTGVTVNDTSPTNRRIESLQ